MDVSVTAPMGMGAASAGVAVTQGNASAIGSDKFACDTCDDIGTDEGNLLLTFFFINHEKCIRL